MERNQFARFADALKRLGSTGVGAPEFVLGREGKFELQYIPFEHVNRRAKLVIVGITPGNTQLSLAYERAQQLLKSGRPEIEILIEVKKSGAFGGPSMKPNLLKMLRHFRFDRLLEISDVETLWAENAHLLQSTSVAPHAAFKAGKMFAGSFKEVMDSPLLAECFLDCFVPSVREMPPDAMFVGLGPCPQAALEWCAQERILQRRQVLGAFCHPASTGGSTTRYYLREVTREQLHPDNPVLDRCEWLDTAYAEMRSVTASLLGDVPPAETIPSSFSGRPVAPEQAEQAGTLSPSTKLTPMTDVTAPAAKSDATRLVSEVRKAGYKLTKETKKLAEFESPAGQVIYLVKTTSRLARINLMVHPKINQDRLRRLDGVDAVSTEHRFHSNMTRFPKRLNGGETETAYGWQVHVDTVGGLSRFLAAFQGIDC